MSQTSKKTQKPSRVTTRKRSLATPKKAVTRASRRITKPSYLTLLPGAPLPGGVFAGLVYDSGAPEALIAGPEYDGEADWATVTEWAKKLNIDGFTDFFLPLRPHGRILQANVPTLFHPSWYWLGEQHASYSDYAWLQNFRNGDRGVWGKGCKLRARAVRRSPI